MKTLVASILLAMFAGLVPAQDTPTPAQKIRTAIAPVISIGNTQGIKNMPVSADEVNESVQTLADGNRIVRSTTGKLYRNSAGSIRRDLPGGKGGMLGSTYSFGPGSFFQEPLIAQSLLRADEAMAKLKVHTELLATKATQHGVLAQQHAAKAGQEPSSAEALAQKYNDRNAVRLEAPGALAMPAMPLMPSIAPLPGITVTGDNMVYSFNDNAKTKYETRMEELGERDFEGVMATGTRRTTIIPADAIGNERPIEIVYERWFSKEMGLVVYSKNTDPRSGEQVYRLTNIVRAEPEPSLFIPKVSRLAAPDGTNVYRVSGSPRKPESVRAIQTGSTTGRTRP